MNVSIGERWEGFVESVVKSGRYVTYRCMQGHGRFATFSSFMVEKGFVRQLTKPEIEDLARRVDAIFCTGCGAPVDIRRDHACPHCRAAFSLLDPAAVEKALQRHAQAARPDASLSSAARSSDLADALVFLMRNYSDAEMINVGSGQEVSIAELAALVADVVGYRGSLRFDASKPDGTPRKQLDSSRLLATGWAPKVALAQGLADTYAWYREHEVANSRA